MVFFSTCMSVKYHHELFNYIDLPVMSIHVSTFLIQVINVSLKRIVLNEIRPIPITVPIYHYCYQTGYP